MSKINMYFPFIFSSGVSSSMVLAQRPIALFRRWSQPCRVRLCWNVASVETRDKRPHAFMLLLLSRRPHQRRNLRWARYYFRHRLQTS